MELNLDHLSDEQLDALQLQVANIAAIEMAIKHWRRLQWLQRVFERWAPHLGCAHAVVLRRPALVVVNRNSGVIHATGRKPVELFRCVQRELRARMGRPAYEWRTRYALHRAKEKEAEKRAKAKAINNAAGGFDEHFELAGLLFDEGDDF